MENNRRHKRYGLEIMEVHGKMSMSDKVEIIDISLGGVGFKADRRLNMGREYQLKLEDKGKTMDVRGTIVRSELIGIESRDDGETVSIYLAGMKFNEGSSEKIADFLQGVERHKKETADDVVEQRLHVRFGIVASREKVLQYPAQFMVKAISLSGMLIKTNEVLGIESRIPMELSLHEGSAVQFVGRVASCRVINEEGRAHYEVGVEFDDLTQKDKLSLMTFIDYLSAKGAEPA
jgi:c-di-GMP-binding flagellar brake protein YcgR